MTPLRSVLLGFGHRGQMHAQALSASDQFELVAICDRNQSNLEDWDFDRATPETYADLHETIAHENPDHISAVTGPLGRPSLVNELLAYEPDSLLIEKPIANTMAGVDGVADAVRDSDSTVTVCHQKPFADEFQTVKGWLDAGTLGDLERISGSTKGGLTGQGTHFIQAMDWFVGDSPHAVRGFAEGPVSLDPSHNPHVPDHAEPEDTVIDLTYPNRVRGSLHLGPNAPDIPEQTGTYWFEFRIDLIGSLGRAELVLGSHARCIAEGQTERVEVRDFEADSYMTRRFYDALAEYLDGERETHVGEFHRAYEVHQTIEATMRSALEGRTVRPGEAPVAGMRPTTVRLRRHLINRQPVVVSTLPFADHSRPAAFDRLASLGVTRVDLWSVPGMASHFAPAEDDPSLITDELRQAQLTVSTLTVDPSRVKESIPVASELGAQSVIIESTSRDAANLSRETIHTWVDDAKSSDLTVVLGPTLVPQADTTDLIEYLDAFDGDGPHVAVAPPAAIRGGSVATERMVRLGERVDAVYLWDAEPTSRTATGWWESLDSQVPGAGGAVDFPRLFTALLDHAPLATPILRLQGLEEWKPTRIDAAIARGMRYVTDARS